MITDKKRKEEKETATDLQRKRHNETGRE